MSLSNLTFLSLARSAWTVAKAALRWPVRITEARRLMRQVGGMSDHELRDIGLTRHDVWDATALPHGADPSRLFQQRVDERRGAGRHHHEVRVGVEDVIGRPHRPERVVTSISGGWLHAETAVIRLRARGEAARRSCKSS